MNSFTTRLLSLLLIVGIAASLFSVIWHMRNEDYKTETAVFTEENDSVTFKAVYVRDEEVINYSGAGVVSYSVSDGGKLAAGSPIADIYADESQIDAKQRIAVLEDKLALLEKIQNPGTLQSAQPAELSELINQRYNRIISLREKKNISGISEETNELTVLLSTYQLLTDENVDLLKRANDIKTEITQLKSRESIPMDSIVSDRSAYFVSYADGYENSLSTSKLQSITPEMIDEVNDYSRSGDKTVVGKLINSYEWYAVGVADFSERQFEKDEKVRLKFRSSSKKINGEVVDIRGTGDPDKKLIVVRCDELTYDLVQHRTERVELIKGSYEGIKVPKEAVRLKNMKVTRTDEETGKTITQTEEVRGVYIKLGEQITFKKLDVVYEDSSFVLSERNAGSDYVSMYDDVVVEGVDADGNRV